MQPYCVVKNSSTDCLESSVVPVPHNMAASELLLQTMFLYNQSSMVHWMISPVSNESLYSLESFRESLFLGMQIMHKALAVLHRVNRALLGFGANTTSPPSLCPCRIQGSGSLRCFTRLLETIEFTKGRFQVAVNLCCNSVVGANHSCGRLVKISLLAPNLGWQRHRFLAFSSGVLLLGPHWRCHAWWPIQVRCFDVGGRSRC